MYPALHPLSPTFKACLDIVIVGGGITGTYAAYSIAGGMNPAGKAGDWRESARVNDTRGDARNRRPPSMTLFEARGELGGRMRSRTLDGRTVELGAEYFTKVG